VALISRKSIFSRSRPSARHDAPPRVAVVYHFLPHYRQGVFDALTNDSDHEVVFVTGHSRPGQEGVLEAQGLQAVEVDNRWFQGVFLWQRGLLSHLWRERYDAVVFLGNWMWATTWLGALLTRARSGAVLFWTHGWTEPESNLQGFLRRRFYRLAHKLLLYGQRAADIGVSYGWDPDDLVVIGNSLALPASDRALEPWRPDGVSDPALPWVIWISRLIDEKRPDLLIDATAEAERRGTPFNVVFVGAGPAEAAARQRAEELTPGRVVFLGAVHDDDVLGSIFARGSVTAVPDYGGLSIPHSLIHGVPVVANDQAGANGPEYEYLRPGFNGSTFQRNDAAGLADELLRWIHDRPLAGEARDAVIARACDDASPQANADRILGAVDSVRARKARR
jgi:glycosyltransferase involved in cell wall biosynthesis